MKNVLPTIPSDIANEIDYALGSIVSKNILISDQLQITLFSVDEGQSFAEHTSSKEAIVHIVEGECRFRLEGKWNVCKVGSFFYMPNGMKHAIEANGKFKFLLYQY
jgi:quercetin dioxygenase-like cupin family protein